MSQKTLPHNLTYLDQTAKLDSVDVTRDARTSEELRRLKAQLHQQLIAGMDLSAISTMNREQLRMEVRRVADELCQRSSNLLNRNERERVVSEVLDETFGLG